MTIQKEFVKFLKHNGIFDRYVHNFVMHAQISEHPRPIKSRYDYFTSAFTWVDTIQGHVFWRGYDKIWSRYIRKKTEPYHFHTRCSRCGRYVKRSMWVPVSDDKANDILCPFCESGF